MNSEANATNQEVHNPLKTMQEGEQVVCEIRRHPIGIFTIYFAIGFVLSILGVIIFAVVPALSSNVDRGQLNYYGSLTLLIAAFIGVSYALVSHIIYWGNRWIVTTDSLTQIEQTGLFTKHASQLSLENLEDVTAEKNGILTTFMNYGVLKAETAGERSKFVFLYCPDPNTYAQKILDARERFVQKVHEVHQTEETSIPTAPSADVPPTDGYAVP